MHITYDLDLQYIFLFNSIQRQLHKLNMYIFMQCNMNSLTVETVLIFFHNVGILCCQQSFTESTDVPIKPKFFFLFYLNKKILSIKKIP